MDCEKLRKGNFKALKNNYEKSMFYQLDLSNVAAETVTFLEELRDYKKNRLTLSHSKSGSGFLWIYTGFFGKQFPD